MRGLPQPPDDVASVVLEWSCSGSPATTTHWLFVPGLQTLTYDALRSLWVLFVFETLDQLVPLMASEGSLRACRIARGGSQPLAVVDHVVTNSGAGSSTKTINAAIGIYWTTSFAGSGGRTLTRLPAFPHEFTDDQRTVNELGYAEIGHSAGLWLQHVNALDSPAGGLCELVTLHRQANGVPLAVAQARALISAVPVPRVATLRRRLNARSLI